MIKTFSVYSLCLNTLCSSLFYIFYSCIRLDIVCLQCHYGNLLIHLFLCLLILYRTPSLGNNGHNKAIIKKVCLCTWERSGALWSLVCLLKNVLLALTLRRLRARCARHFFSAHGCFVCHLGVCLSEQFEQEKWNCFEAALCFHRSTEVKITEWYMIVILNWINTTEHYIFMLTH